MELNLADTKKWIELFVKKVEANTSELNELDTAIGDGIMVVIWLEAWRQLLTRFLRKNQLI